MKKGDKIYYWYRGEKPIFGNILKYYTNKEDNILEIQTKKHIIYLWREINTDEWYDENNNLVHISLTRPKYKPIKRMNFSLYD